MNKELIERIQNATDKTIEDMKNVFIFKTRSPKSRVKYFMIPEYKIGVLRYLMLKNMEEIK